MSYIYETIESSFVTTANLSTTYVNLHLTQSFCSITSSFDASCNMHIISSANCFISSSISCNWNRLELIGKDSGSVTLVAAPGYKDDSFVFADYVYINDYDIIDHTNTLDTFPHDNNDWNRIYYVSTPIYEVYANSTTYGWIENIEINCRFNTNLRPLFANTQITDFNITTASLFMYKTGSGQETLNVGDRYHPTSYSINTVTPASDGWTEFKFNNTGKQNINAISAEDYTDFRVALNGRFVGDAVAVGQTLGPISFVSPDHPDSSKHPYLLFKYAYNDISGKKQASCSITSSISQISDLTIEIMYEVLRSNSGSGYLSDGTKTYGSPLGGSGLNIRPFVDYSPLFRNDEGGATLYVSYDKYWIQYGASVYSVYTWASLPYLRFNLIQPNKRVKNASLFVYKTDYYGDTRYTFFISDGYHPRLDTILSNELYLTGSNSWYEFNLNQNGINELNKNIISETTSSLRIVAYPTILEYQADDMSVNFISMDSTSSEYHPYLEVEYCNVVTSSCNIQTNFLTRTIIYPDLRPDPSNPSEVITQPEAKLSTTANIRLTGRIPKLVLVSDLSEIILFHSNVDGTWMDPNEERQVSIIDGTRRYTKTNDNSEFTINMHIFKEYNPTLKLLEILMIRKELVYFYPDRYALPIENILHKPAEFYISDIIPYYLMTDSDYDAVLIKLKSTRQTYFGDLPALGYGYRYATRYGVGF